MGLECVFLVLDLVPKALRGGLLRGQRGDVRGQLGLEGLAGCDLSLRLSAVLLGRGEVGGRRAKEQASEN